MKSLTEVKELQKLIEDSCNPKEEAEKICVQAVDNNASQEECFQLLRITDKFSIPYGHYKLYKRIGDTFLINQQFEQSFVHYTIAMDILNENNMKEEKVFLFNNMGINKLKCLQYDEAIVYFNSCLMLSKMLKKYDIYIKVLYNLALAYLSIYKVDEAIAAINKCYDRLNKHSEIQLYIKLRILEANCYEEKGTISKCIEIYNSLLEEEDNMDKTLLGNVYNNIASLFLKQKNYSKSSIYFDKAYDNRNTHDKWLLAHVIIDRAELYYETLDLEKFYTAISQGIELCREYNDYEYWIIALMKLERAYKKDNNTEKLRSLYLEILDISKKNNIEKNIMYSLNKLISLEIKLKNYGAAYEYNDMLNQYIENIVNI